MIKTERIKRLKELGYFVMWEQRADEGIESARKDIHPTYDHQHHEFNGKGWNSFHIYSEKGILSWPDEDFEAWLKTLPELEKKAIDGFNEWWEDAKYHESIRRGTNERENKWQAEDKEKIESEVAVIHSQIKFIQFKLKSGKYKEVFTGLLSELDKLSPEKTNP